MSIDYVFFSASLRNRFVQFAKSKGITCDERTDRMGGHLAVLPDNLDDSLAEAIESEYEALMNEQEEINESVEGWVTSDAMGVNVTLSDGQSCVVRIPDTIIRRLTAHFSPDEIHTLVSAIAQSVEHPSDEPICRMK